MGKVCPFSAVLPCKLHFSNFVIIAQTAGEIKDFGAKNAISAVCKKVTGCRGIVLADGKENPVIRYAKKIRYRELTTQSRSVIIRKKT